MQDPAGALTYPLESSPEPGKVLEVAPGVLWLRLPLPFQLNHINVWLIREDDGWALVDTGIHTRHTREIWKQVLQHELGGAPLTRVVATHLHPDHVGCAGWLARRFDVDLWMSRDEYLLCRVLVADTGNPAPPEGIRFYRAAGFDDSALDRYTEFFGAFGRVVAPLPQSYRRLQDDCSIRIGDFTWEVIIGRGHSPEHACLLCRELGVIIAGDQILPTISPNVSVYPTEPAANPLKFWFDSLRKMLAILPEDVLVLPAHGEPFLGAHGRLDELIEEHETGLDKLRELGDRPRRAVDVFPALFKSRISDNNLMMAAGEAISHLNYLVELGEFEVRRDASGVDWYRKRQ
jgi:glyoxylase-like metal-dependent hydrolase (beta-lactamase superfamily II)